MTPGNEKVFLQAVAVAIADHAKKNGHRTVNLNLADSKITGSKPTALAKIIREGLVGDIDLSRNQIGDEGAKLLLSAIESDECPSLSINLASNGLTQKTVEFMGEWLKDKDLRTIDLRGNSLSVSDLDLGSNSILV